MGQRWDDGTEANGRPGFASSPATAFAPPRSGVCPRRLLYRTGPGVAGAGLAKARSFLPVSHVR